MGLYGLPRVYSDGLDSPYGVTTLQKRSQLVFSTEELRICYRNDGLTELGVSTTGPPVFHRDVTERKLARLPLIIMIYHQKLARQELKPTITDLKRFDLATKCDCEEHWLLVFESGSS